jgi:type IV secretory pathway TraG/TraD family ATPase VirD4
VAGIVVAVIGSLWRARQSRLAIIYGSSRWASRPEVEAASLFRPAGVLLGRRATGICDTTSRSNEAVKTAAHSGYRQRRRAMLQSTAGSDDAALADPGITMSHFQVARRSDV